MAPLTAESNNQVRVSSNRLNSERLMARHVRWNGRVGAGPRSRSAAHEHSFARRALRASFPMQRFGSALATSCRLSYLDESARQWFLDSDKSSMTLDNVDVPTLAFSTSAS
jgi:hypothetical protein